MEYALLAYESDETYESNDEFELKSPYLTDNYESILKRKMGISCSSILSICRNKAHKTQPRNVMIGRRDLNSIWYPQNVIRNQKYNLITFIPLVLFEQFRFFHLLKAFLYLVPV